MENSLTGIYINLDEKIVFANRRFADIFGYTVDEIIGIDYLELVHPEDRPKVREIHGKRLAGEAAPPMNSGDMILISNQTFNRTRKQRFPVKPYPYRRAG